jgi:glycine/D-amino acid oxidase-like deaminating enzyme
MSVDAIVIGGGKMGGAIGFGLTRQGMRIVVLDEGDSVLRPSRGAFGRIVVSGKGVGVPHYTRWTRMSIDAWPDFAAELEELTGIATGFGREGGVFLCFSDAEFEDKAKTLALCRAEAGDLGFDFEMLDNRALRELFPDLGPTMPGGAFCRHDGEINTLYLLRALHAGIVAGGGRYLSGERIAEVRRDGGGFAVRTGGETHRAAKLVIAAGHGTSALARQVGLEIPVRPERGQLLVTEKTAQFMKLPTDRIRQTREGTVLIGRIEQEAGFDDSATLGTMRALAGKAVRAFPRIAGLRLVRAWGCLRILTPDSLPVYTESPTHPGAFVVTCHSAISLAAAHARHIARWIATDQKPAAIDGFDERRFETANAV